MNIKPLWINNKLCVTHEIINTEEKELKKKLEKTRDYEKEAYMGKQFRILESIYSLKFNIKYIKHIVSYRVKEKFLN